jgi:hypothetical protein
MRKITAGLVLVVVTMSSFLLGADTERISSTEVTKNPALLVSSTAKVSELTVYGVKLGDSIDNIPGNAGVTRQPLEARPQDAVYTGANVWYFAHDGRIYRIKVLGEIVQQLPPYDSTRLQIALGKADESIQNENATAMRLSFFARHVAYVVHEARDLPVLTEADLYAP